MTSKLVDRKKSVKRAIRKEVLKGRKLIIVEGIDDIKFYSDIIELLNYDTRARVKNIENITGTGGCNEVKRIYDENYNDLKINGDLSYFYCILDKDYDLLNTRSTLNTSNLLVLKYYSYESHLIYNKRIEDAIKHFIRAPKNEYCSNITEFIMNNISTEVLNKLYYLTAYSLMHWYKTNTILFSDAKFSDIGNSIKLDHVYNKYIVSLLPEIDEYIKIAFADDNINKIEFIKKYYRGKDLLSLYSNLIPIYLKRLKNDCVNEKIISSCPQLNSSESASSNCKACLWAFREGDTISSKEMSIQLKSNLVVEFDLIYISEFLENAINSI